MSDMFSLGFLAVVLILVVAVFVRISLRLRRGGGSLTTTVLGATDEFLTRDRSKMDSMVGVTTSAQRRVPCDTFFVVPL